MQLTIMESRVIELHLEGSNVYVIDLESKASQELIEKKLYSYIS